MARSKGSRKVSTRSAYTWRAFFELFRSKPDRSTEAYVSSFSAAFNLRPAEYQLGGRIVIL